MTVLFAVDIGDGVVVMHTAEEYARLMHGVDLEACDGMAADLDDFIENEPEDDT